MDKNIWVIFLDGKSILCIIEVILYNCIGSFVYTSNFCLLFACSKIGSDKTEKCYTISCVKFPIIFILR